MEEWLYAAIGNAEIKSIASALVVAALVGLGARYFRPRSRVIWAQPSGFTFRVPIASPGADGQPVERLVFFHTKTIWVQNIGRETADEVEVHFNFKPPHVEVFPDRKIELLLQQEGRYVLSTPSLAPGETFTVQMMSVDQELPWIANLRWRQGGAARQVRMSPQRVFPPWAQAVFGGLMVIGFIAVLYVLALLLWS